MKISIIIPVFNESKTILKILKKINEIKNIKKEIIIINEGSTDNTKKIIVKECLGLFDRLISYKFNKGKGFACRKGLKYATGQIIIIQDGKLTQSYDESSTSSYMKGENIEINIEIFTGNKNFTAYTMDLTKEYVKINADYRS